MTTPTTRWWPGLFFDKGGAVFNVKHPDFGAKGDGVADDTQAIQDAITAAEAESEAHNVPGAPAQNSYATIVFPPGNYLLQAGLVTSIGVLRVVGLGNANLIKVSGFPTTDPPTPAWKMAHPFQASFEGLSFIGFPTGLELGESTYNVATASAQLVRTNFYKCTTGLKYGSRSSTLSLDYCKFNDNTKHIEIWRCDLIHLNRCHFNKFTPAANGNTAIHVGTGRIHVYGSSFTPGPVTTAENAWIGIYDTFYDGVGQAHIGLVAHGVRAGDENGGLTFVNYNAAPDTTYPLNVTKILIRDSQMGPGQGNNGRDQCIVRLWKTPNQVEITGCQWSAALPVDWSATLPANPDALVHTDGPNTPLVYRVEGNCDNANPARTRHWMPAAFEGKANLLGGIRRGTSTISYPSDRITVDLGLPTGAAIRAKDISVTPLSGLAGATSWWVELIADDHFDIRLDAVPDTKSRGVKFAWSVDLGRY